MATGFATGGYVESYNYTITGIEFIGGNSTNSGISVVASMPPTLEKILFAMTCHVFGLDTPELISSFRKEYDKIKARMGDTDEQVYEFLIKAAYEVKYGTDTD